MAHIQYKNPETAVASTNTSGNKIRTEANKLIRDNEFEFHEHDIFEVGKIFLDKKEIKKTFGITKQEKYYGGIQGRYVHDNTQSVLPTADSPVIPLDPNIRLYPVIGEYVVCINHMGRTYYKTIINWDNNPNNNIQQGLASSNRRLRRFKNHTIYTKEKDYHRNTHANPGDLIIQGRYGSSISLGAQQLTEPSIKLVAGVKQNSGEFDINKDGASIYIQDGGSVDVKNPNKKFKQYPVVGSKVVINADEIVLNARNNLKLVSGNRTEILGKDIELKHNKGGSIFTGETKELLDNTRDRVKNEVIREIEECIQQILLITDKAQEDFERVSKLIEKLQNIPELSRDAVDRILGAEISINNENFTKLQNKYNKLSEEMDELAAEERDLAAAGLPSKDPVKRVRILVEKANLIRQFADIQQMFRPNIKLGKPSE